jgi:hypothetical protein
MCLDRVVYGSAVELRDERGMNNPATDFSNLGH